MQNLSHLPDDQIDAVISAVTLWCRSQGVTIESDEGRRAVSVAANLISATNILDFYAELASRLNARPKNLA